MRQPAFLKPGDRIRVVSPSGKVNADKIGPGIECLRAEGFELLVAGHVFGSHFQFAGTDEERLQDLQEALDDPDCRAIVCARGGYGAIRLAEQLCLDAFRRNPKWLVGFSDITVLHALIQKEGFCSIHGPMPGFYLKEGAQTESFRQLVAVLKGESSAYAFETHSLNRNGEAAGELCGGNLSIVYSLLGTPWQLETEGKILFIEDLSEYLYHLDRMMYGLKLSGSLKGLKALLVGSFTDLKDNDSPFGQSVEEIILSAVKDYNYPVLFNCPSGHIDENMPLVFGRTYGIGTANGQVLLESR